MQNRRLRKKKKKSSSLYPMYQWKSQEWSSRSTTGSSSRGLGTPQPRAWQNRHLQKMSSTLFELYILSNLKISHFTDSCYHLADFSILLPRHIRPPPRNDCLVWDVQDEASRYGWLGCKIVRRRKVGVLHLPLYSDFRVPESPTSDRWCIWSTHVLFGPCRKF